MNNMLFVVLIIVSVFLRWTSALLLSTANRVATRNITCRSGSSSTNLVINCEACLIISRNYPVTTKLSIAGAGPSGISYSCLTPMQVEGIHENLVRECLNFPRDALNGYDDFCIASPFRQIRGSYRACMCTSNRCNYDYTECFQRVNPTFDQKPPAFTRTIVELTDRVNCYRSYDDNKQVASTSLVAPLCSMNDDECKNFLLQNGVLCSITIDRSNQISRQTLPPSIYTAYILQFKSIECNAFTWQSKSIVFTQCRQGQTVCMCATDGCDIDMDTCRASKAIYRHSISIFLLLVTCTNFLMF